MRRTEPGLDVYRGVLVLAMIAVHARRMEAASARAVHGAGRAALDLLAWTEPFVAAAFLFVAGASLVLARRAAVDAASFRRRLPRRVAGLLLLSMALFVLEYGFELPDLVVSSGVLGVIALGSLACGGALLSPHRDALLVALAALAVAVTALLDTSGASVPGLNAGPGGAVPMLAFTALGALGFARGTRGFAALTALLAVPFGVVLVSGQPWLTERVSRYASHASGLALTDLFARSQAGHGTLLVTFWNHSALGAVALFFPLCLGLLAFVTLPRAVAAHRALDPLALLGRHALLAYVGHLGLLGLVQLHGFAPATPGQTWALWAALVAACLAAALAATAARRRGTRRAP